jgi:imidazole glycerol-phosphate synthase subunit HisH
MRASLFDYGAGNLHSLERALTRLGVKVSVSTDPLLETDLLVLPGVGAFGLAADCLRPTRDALRGAITAGRPLLGICLGMQLLFDASEEDGSTAGRGLSLLDGTVTKLKTRRVPHIGWTRLEETNTAMYFAHSFVCRPLDESIVTAWARHDDERFPAAVKSGRIAGVQFHPEKSSTDGLDLLESLVRQVTS